MHGVSRVSVTTSCSSNRGSSPLSQLRNHLTGTSVIRFLRGFCVAFLLTLDAKLADRHPGVSHSSRTKQLFLALPQQPSTRPDASTTETNRQVPVFVRQALAFPQLKDQKRKLTLPSLSTFGMKSKGTSWSCHNSHTSDKHQTHQRVFPTPA